MTRKEIISSRNQALSELHKEEKMENSILDSLKRFSGKMTENFHLVRESSQEKFSLSISNLSEKSLEQDKRFIKTLMYLGEDDAIERINDLIEQLMIIRDSLNDYLNEDVDYEELRKEYIKKEAEKAESENLYKTAKEMVHIGYNSHDSESWYACPNCKKQYGSWGMLNKRIIKCECGLVLRVPR